MKSTQQYDNYQVIDNCSLLIDYCRLLTDYSFGGCQKSYITDNGAFSE